MARTHAVPSRRTFLRNLGGAMTLGGLVESVAAGTASTPRMPVLFVGHGSPMNALEDNAFTRMLHQWGENIPKPRAILVVSAHWLTQGQTAVATTARPETIHDFGGFPDALNAMQYPAPGAPAVARETLAALKRLPAVEDTLWGLDHGAWTVLHHMVPRADVPVFQVSIDYSRDGRSHYAIGRDLAVLRDHGVLIVASGNIVHNLRRVDRGAAAGAANQPWAQAFDGAVKSALVQGNAQALVDYRSLDASHALAVPTPDHYWPLLYAVGAAQPGEKPVFAFEGFQFGTLSMRCVQWG
jgi:4,5-DOPA dioxygenase extradiol